MTSLGYSIMDDASGNYYGRKLLRDYYFNQMPHDLKLVFETRYDVNEDAIKKALYKKPNPNAYLATFAEFLILNKESDYIQNVIKEGLREFVETMILTIQRRNQNRSSTFCRFYCLFYQEKSNLLLKNTGLQSEILKDVQLKAWLITMQKLPKVFYKLIILLAITLISTFTNFGKFATSTVSLAGAVASLKYCP